MAKINDDDPPGGGDWFDQQGPPPAALPAAAPDDFAKQVTSWYQQYLGRTPSQQEIDSHRGNPGGLDAVQKVIQGAAGKNGEANPAATPAGGSEAALRAQIAQWAGMPGADPSLKNDPDYWVRAITAKGGLTDANKQYWQDASVGPTAFFNNPNRESAGRYGAADYTSGNFGAPPAPYVSNPNAPTYTPLPTPDGLSTPYVAPTWTGGEFKTPDADAAILQKGFTAPTAADLENSPGYRERFKMGLDANQRSAAGQGSILNGGTQKALARYGQDYASTEYNNFYGQSLATRQQNVSDAQTDASNAYRDYMTRYGQFTDAATRGFQARQQNEGEFQNAVGNNQQTYTNRYGSYLNDNARTLSDYLTNVTTQRNNENDYWSRLNDLYQTGATAANNSYKPGPTA